jgi:hypothetical protein
MNKFLGENDQLIRFLLLTCGLLTLAGAVACLLMGNAILAVASCVVSAWAIGFYLDTVWGPACAPRRERPDRHQDDTSAR